jgi:hypothetical protein
MAVVPCNIPAIRDHKISLHRSIKALCSRSHVCVLFFVNSGSPSFIRFLNATSVLCTG